MMTILCRAGRFQRVLCLTLAVAIAAAPLASAMAQTNAAAMAVRQRVEGLSPEGPESRQPQGAPGPGQAPSTGSDTGKIDTRYISPNAIAVAVIRPAQILATPIAQMLPVELATTLTGFDPMEMAEIVAFADLPTAAGLSYGVAFKFKNPVRASAIPLERRNHVQLAELKGKKYLRSASPFLYSLYAPNNRTLVAATDATLQQFVASVEQPKSGPMIDRLREVPAGTDLFLAVNVASLRPFLPLVMGGDPAKAPPAVKKQLEMLNQISAAELTLNISNPGPSSFIARCADDAAAQKLESLVQEAKQTGSPGSQPEQPGMVNPILQATTRYRDRLSRLFPMQRDGTNFTFFRVDGQNPAQQQFVSAVVVLSGSVASMVPEILAAQNKMRGQSVPVSAAPLGAPGSPESPPPQ
jgi:hypothetical protein